MARSPARGRCSRATSTDPYSAPRSRKDLSVRCSACTRSLPDGDAKNMTSELSGLEAPAGERGPGCVVERTALQRDGRPIDVLTLRNVWGMEVRFLTLGGIIVSIKVPDRHGKVADVVLGYDDLASYLHDENYFGALIGRSANR